MKNIAFLKEPGYTYDLFFIFAAYFNKEKWLDRMINKNKPEEDKEYFDKVLEPYLPISDEMLLFFYWKDGNRIFMSEKYFDPYKEEWFAGKYNLSVVLNALSDYNQVINNVIRFYFRDIAEEELMAYRNSLPALNRLIKESKYESEVKNALYEFFIEPIPVIQKLIDELKAKEALRAQQYQKDYDKILKVQESFDYNKFSDLLMKMKNPVNLYDHEVAYVSFCLMNKNLAFFQLRDDFVLFMLGVDYISTIESLIGYKDAPELDIFGNAIAEKNRIEILELICEKEEVALKDVVQELGFTGTNAYYHLMLMTKAGILKTRTLGRTMLYSIDKSYFMSLLDRLKKYTE